MKKRYITMLAAGLLVMGGALSTEAGVVITPQLSTLQSPDTDNVVTFDASRSACYDYTMVAMDQVTGTTYECSGGTGEANSDPINYTGVCLVDGIAGAANSCNAWADCLPTCDLSGADLSTDPIVPGICSDGINDCITNTDCRNSMLTSGTVTPLTCDFVWDFGDGGTGVNLGGRYIGEVVYQYAAAGSYTVTLDISEPISGATASTNATVTAVEVEPAPITVDFSTAVTDALCVANECVGGGMDGNACTANTDCPGGEVTLNFATTATNLARAYIYWGDQKRTTLVNPADSSSATHMYSRERTYNIRVLVLDSGHQKLNYTSSADPDLLVTP